MKRRAFRQSLLGLAFAGALSAPFGACRIDRGRAGVASASGFSGGAPAIEVQVVLSLVIDEQGAVESAIVSAHLPLDAAPAFDQAALDAIRAAHFRPSLRDGNAFRSRVEYVVVFHPPR